MPSDRIVVGVDGSQGSLCALRWALREAKTTGCCLDVVHVWTDPWSVGNPPSLIGAGRQGLADLKAELREWVSRAAKSEGAEDVNIVERIIAGRPAEALSEEAAGARLLVVGRTGVTGLRRWMLGSVGQRCAHISPVPVVFVPGPERDRAKAEDEDPEHRPLHVVTGAN